VPRADVVAQPVGGVAGVCERPAVPNPQKRMIDMIPRKNFIDAYLQWCWKS